MFTYERTSKHIILSNLLAVRSRCVRKSVNVFPRHKRLLLIMCKTLPIRMGETRERVVFDVVGGVDGGEAKEEKTN